MRGKKREEEAWEKAYELGKKNGKKEIIDKLIELLELDDRYAPHSHGHSFLDD